MFRIATSGFIAALMLHPLLRAQDGEKTTESPSESAAQEATAEAGGKQEGWESEKRQAALRVQLFLDAKGFGPGKIDGHWGGFSEKAAVRWNASNQTPKIEIAEGGQLDSKSASELPVSRDLIKIYTITEVDQKLVGNLPEDPEEQAKLEDLPYANLMEVISEKFHCDPDFLVEVNGLDSPDELKVGLDLKVPNIAEPFDITEPKQLAKSGKPDEAKSGLEVTVLLETRVVEVRENGSLILSFPISPGEEGNNTPEGNWKVTVISWMPEFRWDKSMLDDGERSDEFHMLPPGPNNPVGIVWIGLDADGIGLHGTAFPDAIGRNSSHGCIRLSNWDALKLGKKISVGTPVVVK